MTNNEFALSDLAARLAGTEPHVLERQVDRHDGTPRGAECRDVVTCPTPHLDHLGSPFVGEQPEETIAFLNATSVGRLRGAARCSQLVVSTQVC